MQFNKFNLSKLIYSASPEVCMDVTAWAREKGIQTKVLQPSILPDARILVADDPIGQKTIAAHINAIARDQTLVPIEKAVIRDEDGLVELPDGKICYEGNWWLPYLTSSWSYKKRFEWRNRHLRGNFYSLLCLWGGTYFHWFHDVLPRLFTALPHLPDDTRFLINECPKEFQILTLKALGISSDRLEFQPARMNTRVERLWFATPLGHSGLTSPVILKNVVERIRNCLLPKAPSARATKLWVSRANAVSRRIRNEKDLAGILSDFGVESIRAEDFSFQHQLEVFVSASMVIGPHGAGLTNSFFCEEGTKVCEIAIDGVPPCYLVACRGLKLDFTRIMARSLGPDHNADMELEAGQLTDYLSRM
jgi:capsular polysaccharide biosynthesis protein